MGVHLCVPPGKGQSYPLYQRIAVRILRLAILFDVPGHLLVIIIRRLEVGPLCRETIELCDTWS